MGIIIGVVLRLARGTVSPLGYPEPGVTSMIQRPVKPDFVGIPSIRLLINNLLVVFSLLMLAPLEGRGSLELSRLCAISRTGTIGTKSPILFNALTITQLRAVIDSVITPAVEASILMAGRVIEKRDAGWLLKAGIPFTFTKGVVIGFICVRESKLGELHVITDDRRTLYIECSNIAWIDSSLNFG